MASFEILKDQLNFTLVLALPNFKWVFEVEVDAYMLVIGMILLQEGRLIEYFSEKLNNARQKWTTYE